jgi:hypothetical protein
MPLVIAVIEFVFLGRELPSLRSWIALSGELLRGFFFFCFSLSQEAYFEPGVEASGFHP